MYGWGLVETPLAFGSPNLLFSCPFLRVGCVSYEVLLLSFACAVVVCLFLCLGCKASEFRPGASM